MSIITSPKLSESTVQICKQVLRKTLSVNFPLLERVKYLVRNRYYFVLKDEGKDDYGLAIHEHALGYTYIVNGKGIIQVYMDDWYIPRVNKVMIGYNYYDIVELARRVSHELTHLYAFHNRLNYVHRFIDDMVRDGRESELPMKKIEIMIIGKTMNCYVYDVKSIASLAMSNNK